MNIYSHAQCDIINHPEDEQICEGDDVAFSVSVTDDTGTVYQWEVSADNGQNWEVLTDNALYTDTNKDTLLLASIPATLNQYMYRLVSSNGSACSDTSQAATLTVLEPPSPPEVADTVKYCEFEEASPLTAVGENLTWYIPEHEDSVTYDTPTHDTENTGIFEYNVTQTQGACESDKATIVVDVVRLTGFRDWARHRRGEYYCQGNSPSEIRVTGENITWYETRDLINSSDERPVIHKDSAYSKNYYYTQTVRGCEGLAQYMNVRVFETPEPPYVEDQHLCRFDEPTPPVIEGGDNLFWMSRFHFYYTSTDPGWMANTDIPGKQRSDFNVAHVNSTISYGGEIFRCRSQVLPITATVHSLPNATLSLTEDTICYEGSTQLNFQLLEGSSDFSVTYTNPSGDTTQLTSENKDSIIRIDVDVPGTYTLINVIDSAGCTTSFTDQAVELYQREQHPPPEIIIHCGTENEDIDEGLFQVHIHDNSSSEALTITENSSPPVPFSHSENGWTSSLLDTTKSLDISISDQHDCLVLDTAGITGHCDCVLSASLSTSDPYICERGANDNARITLTIHDDDNVYTPYAFTILHDGSAVISETAYTDKEYVFTVYNTGTYTIDKIEGQCTGSPGESVDISSYSTPEGTITGDTTVCDKDADIVYARVQLEQGTPPYTFSLNSETNSPYNITTGSNEYDVPVNKSDSLYFLSLSDGNHCVASHQQMTGSASIHFSEIPEAVISTGTVGDTIAFCEGETIYLHGSSSNATSAYWSGPTVTGHSPTQHISGLAPGTYQYLFTSNNVACGDQSDSIYISVHPEISSLPEVTLYDVNGNLLDKNDPVCDAQLPLTLEAPATESSQQWYRDGQPIPDAHSGIYHTEQPGDYFVTTRDTSCPVGYSDTVHIQLHSSPWVDAGDDIKLYLSDEEKQVQLSGQTNADSFSWTSTGLLANPEELSTTMLPEYNGRHMAILTAISMPCTASDTVMITIHSPIQPYNAFTPNGDGINDTWEIRGISTYQQAHIQVFNRWGNKVYESIGYSSPWDGTFNGKALPVGTYYYIISPGEKGTQESLRGDVTIIR